MPHCHSKLESGIKGFLHQVSSLVILGPILSRTSSYSAGVSLIKFWNPSGSSALSSFIRVSYWPNCCLLCTQGFTQCLLLCRLFLLIYHCASRRSYCACSASTRCSHLQNTKPTSIHVDCSNDYG